MTASEKSHRAENLPRKRRLWGGWMIAIIAWVLHLAVSYGLVEWYCHNRQALHTGTVKAALHLTTLVCVILALFGARLAWRTLNQLKSDHGDRGYERSRFMAKVGILISAFFALIILVEGLPNLVFQPCL